MFRNGNMNKKMPENQTSVLFGKNIDEKNQFKNLSKSNRKGRAENSCKLLCNKSMKGKTLTNPDFYGFKGIDSFDSFDTNVAGKPGISNKYEFKEKLY